MKTKLTLSVERDLVEKAKQYAEAQGTSVSRLVEKYFALIGQGQVTEETKNSAFTRALRGALSEQDVTEDDYYRHLQEKHR